MSFGEHDETNQIKDSSEKSKDETVKTPKRKIIIEVDEDDPCIKREELKKVKTLPGQDPRFQQQNQTLRCFVMYTDFFRCERILGEGASECEWFKDVFTTICPNEWIRQWDEYRSEGRFPWPKYHKLPEFPEEQ